MMSRPFLACLGIEILPLTFYMSVNTCCAKASKLVAGSSYVLYVRRGSNPLTCLPITQKQRQSHVVPLQPSAALIGLEPNLAGTKLMACSKKGERRRSTTIPSTKEIPRDKIQSPQHFTVAEAKAIGCSERYGKATTFACLFLC